jgi:hypothetical protein
MLYDVCKYYCCRHFLKYTDIDNNNQLETKVHNFVNIIVVVISSNSLLLI